MGLNISDVAQQTYLRSVLTQVRSQMLTTQGQISSGKIASIFSDLGGVDSLRSLSLRADRNKINTYKDNIATVGTRVQVMDAALVDNAHDASDLVADMQVPPQNTNTAPAGLTGFNTVSTKQLESLVDRMNTKVDGRYVFAGGLTATAPIDQSQMPTFLNNVKTALTTFYGSAQNAAAVQTLEDAVRNAIPWGGAGTAAANFTALNAPTNTVQAQVDDQTNVDYTVKATDNGFVDTLIGYAITSQLQYGQAGETDAGFWKVYNRQLELMRGTSVDASGTARPLTFAGGPSGGSNQLTALDARLGVLQKSLDTTTATHEKTGATLDKFIGTVEDTDVADALTRLDSLQAQLTASYKLMAQLKDLSLINFI
ncbi:flagellin [Roseiterribacter gracilis]|uniref:Flagellin n=1 Tax=Roseiterribacter gracilis TaxID=2812848 RepID=A0A8S8XBD3_9PROT|nr:flagellin [Rhodospirillales bacterium TMPK1]